MTYEARGSRGKRRRPGSKRAPQDEIILQRGQVPIIRRKITGVDDLTTGHPRSEA